jgi:hypothetical protein
MTDVCLFAQNNVVVWSAADTGRRIAIVTCEPKLCDARKQRDIRESDVPQLFICLGQQGVNLERLDGGKTLQGSGTEAAGPGLAQTSEECVGNVFLAVYFGMRPPEEPV